MIRAPFRPLLRTAFEYRPSSPDVLPTNTLAPSIAGDPYIGETLTATPGTWTGADSVSGEWYVDGVATSETGLTYEVQLADAGLLIEYRETASNTFGSSTASASVVAASLTENVEALYAGGEQGAWYDPSDLSTLFQDAAGTTPVTASADPAGYMGDKSGNGWHMLQATSGKRPVYIVDGSLKALRFNGTSACMSALGVDMAGVSKATLVVCIKQNSDSGVQCLIEHGVGPADSTGGFGAYFNNTASGSIGGGIGQGGSFVFNSGPTGIVPRTDVVSIVYDPAGASLDAKCAIRVNGVPVDETQAASSGTVPAAFAVLDLYLGARAKSVLFANVDLYYMACVGRELTAGELSSLESHAAGKGGVSSFFDLTPSVFTDTGAASLQSGYFLTSVYSSFDINTSAESLDVFTRSTIYDNFPTYAEVGIYVNGVYNQRIAAAANGPKITTITLPAGDKIVSLVNGLQARPNPVAAVLGTWVTRVHSSVGLSQTNLTPSNRVLIYGDSIAVGDHASPPVEKGWAMLVRAAYGPDSLALEAWGSRSLHEDCVDATARAAFVAKIVAYAPERIWLAIGTNDYGLNKWAAASFGTAYAALLDDLHTALPSATIFCQTPLLRTTETANGSGSTMGDYRTQIATAVSTRTAYATLVDGTAIMTTGSLADGVHPTTAGHALYASAVIAELGI